MNTFFSLVTKICVPINIFLFFFGIFMNSKEIVGLAGGSLLLLLIPKLIINNEKAKDKKDK